MTAVAGLVNAEQMRTLWRSDRTGFAVMALTLFHGAIHPTRNLVEPDEACDLDYVPEGARKHPVEYLLKNSFGFAGGAGYRCHERISTQIEVEWLELNKADRTATARVFLPYNAYTLDGFVFQVGVARLASSAQVEPRLLAEEGESNSILMPDRNE